MAKSTVTLPQAEGSRMKTFSIFNTRDFNTIIKDGIQISKLMKLSIQNTTASVEPNEEVNQVNITSATNESSVPLLIGAASDETLLFQSSVPDVKYCSFCNTGFSDQLEQRQHYKLDWHRYNIKLNIKQKPSVTEQQFTQITDSVNNNDDVSSISGSESDEESGDDDSSQSEATLKQTNIGTKTRVIFENSKGNIITLYSCLFNTHKNKVSDDCGSLTESEYLNMVNELPNTLSKMKWFIIMLGGGHFAAAIFQGAEPILHKTFHSYTVRAKQGGAQSSKDNKRATNAKSAGASLRRYNEQSLSQHIQDILSSWTKELSDCKLLFYRAVGPGNRSMLFGGKQAPLNRNDPRLFSIPFVTRRATHKEVKRVHSLLTSIYIYDSKEAFSNIFQLNKKQNSVPIKKKKDCTNRASKQRQSPTRDNYDKKIDDIVNQLKLESSSDNESDEYANNMNKETISFNESLEEYDNTPVPLPSSKDHKKNIPEDAVTNVKKKKKKKKNDKETGNVNISVGVIGKLARTVHLGCINNDVVSVQKALKDYEESLKISNQIIEHHSEENDAVRNNDQSNDGSESEIVAVCNQTTKEGLTLLQHAAKNSQKEIVRFLLENGGDPCARDKKKILTAYDFATDKDTRNVFRRFMGEFPDKYDYSKSHIPSPLTDDIEKQIADKKRALRKAKKEKVKEKWIADEPRRQEEAEKQRFLDLSDREKRALAAERRILASVGKAAENLALIRCYQCAINITGKVPFEYNNFVFCSMDCLKAHRKTLGSKPL